MVYHGLDGRGAGVTWGEGGCGGRPSDVGGRIDKDMGSVRGIGSKAFRYMGEFGKLSMEPVDVLPNKFPPE